MILKEKIPVIIAIQDGDRTEELFCSSDRGGEKESEGVCGGFDS